ncbi:hypothetical protein RJ640_000807, partial [Escallonia rubra]
MVAEMHASAATSRSREGKLSVSEMEQSGGGGSRNNKKSSLTDVVFSWTLEDIFNEGLYKNQFKSSADETVEKIPLEFNSVEQYVMAFIFPLLEDIRAELSTKIEAISSAPFARVISLKKSKPYKTSLYDVEVDKWKNNDRHHGKEPYRPIPGDIFLITDAKPERMSDLQRLEGVLSFGYNTKVSGDDERSTRTGTLLKVKGSEELDIEDRPHKPLSVVFLINITTNNRIWNAMHSCGDNQIIKEVIRANSVVQAHCDMCPLERNEVLAQDLNLKANLDESQLEAVVSSICNIKCNHRSYMELIWGPPGTGKTRTVSMLLLSLLRLKSRTLTCAPTDVAITEVASRVLKLMKESFQTQFPNCAQFCCLGDILLFGNMDQVAFNVEEIHLDYRVEKLVECFGPVTGWKHCVTSMIEFLDGVVSKYQMFCRNQLMYEEQHIPEFEASKVQSKSFLEFARDCYKSAASALKRCISILCTHVPKSIILEHNFQHMVSLVAILDSFETLLFRDGVASEELKEVFRNQWVVEMPVHDFPEKSTLASIRSKCRRVLTTLFCSLDGLGLPSVTNKGLIVEFCFQAASSIFCTASSSYKLRSVAMDPIRLLVIDEAAQLKECESIVPLQLPCIKHAILIGDECQLPAMISSTVSEKAGFGRSLFERLSLLGHSKHLLSTQYRMHPSVSCFPNAKFYQNRITDAPMVKNKSYEKRYLSGPMYGPFSFINISGGKEVLDDGNSLKNFVEIAVVLKLLQLLYKACDASRQKISIGVISPYSAQVSAIQHKLGQKYENHGSFRVKVGTIDGFQGVEDDVIIISTVRSNRNGSVGFISSPRRTNVALTRARHCVWILGCERTLTDKGSVWEDVIIDAKVRQCFCNAEEDKDLEKVILEVKKELDQLDDLLNRDSIIFRNAKWKVLFSDNFRKSFAKLKSVEMKNLSLLLLSKLSSGWRPKSNAGVSCESSSNILRKFKVGELFIVCSVDIVKESWFIQALKVWDILPLQDISKLVKRLDNIFSKYTEDYLTRCGVKLLEGTFEVPMRWAPSSHIVQYKSLSNSGTVEPIDAGAVDGKSYVENSKVRDSLLLMKFYSLSSGAVSNLLSSCNGGDDLPFELTAQEQEIVLFDRSTFVLGRSGTGKTTVLTMKLFRNEQLYHISSEGFHEVASNPCNDVGWRYEVSESDGEAKGDILRQLFVTVSPKLCYAVKRHVSQLKRSVCGGNSSTNSDSMRMDEIDDAAQFMDIPDTFVDLSPKAYPLIITFRKFLLMLDGTVGTSYFERFRDVRQTCQGITSTSRSVVLEAFIRNNEVNYDRFCSSYWPHFNIRLTKILDPSMVFTEIMSVIKGGLRTGDSHDGRLCQQDYVSISEDRGSTLSKQKREVVYEIFLEYEKKKVEYGDFDIADLVIDLHKRFKDKVFEGDEMDFVYIDEVQDLSMQQISLFKYICRNVDEGFVFSGDTAQTIARGIDFRFEDIRCLFYKEFVFGSKGCATDRRSAKGRVSKILHLSQNFRTHAGVLKLGESVLSLIYHFFPSSVDILSPESSLLFGEAPILLNIGNHISLMTILESSGEAGDVVGFGAEQVILVRDECMKKEISEYVGKRALVLTIMECKGLEFQDVLLYNFFSSSPHQDEWRVIYGYMEEKDMLKSSPKHFTSFSWEKHSVLCSEMKNLYVAITRTKQRLWIWENAGFSQPIFDYWKNSYLVEERQVDDAFIQEMQVASSQEEWKSRGIKLYYENNYEVAMVCFERAGDAYWEKMAKASGLRAAAARTRAPNSDMWCSYLKEAAEIFYSIDVFEASAQCYFEINEYKRAGTIYQQKFGESKLEKAGECFSLAKCHKLAAEAYARARSYLKSLSACIDGKLFEMGLLYIRSWKEQTTFHADKLMEAHRSIEDFLETGALHYYELKDKRTMMRFVKSFHSGDRMRIFLRNLDCLDELLLLEIELKNFLAAADIAKLKEDHVLEADFVEKAGLFREASMLILWLVFTNILHPQKGECRPSNQYMQKKELLTKAKSIAEKHSDLFYEFVSTEAEILSRGETAGEILEVGLEFIGHWKSRAPSGLCRINKTSHQLNQIEQYLLEKCARHYYDLEDKRTMMKYVKKFESLTLIRGFLKDLNCLDELMSLEEELRNFLEAAYIAEQKRDILRKADLLEKAGHYKEASLGILWYVLPRSLWVPKSEGWPLKQFHLKDELLTKAISFAKNLPDSFCSFFCMEATVLSNKGSSLSEMRKYLSASHDQKSLRCEILTAWKVLDAHLNVATSKYEWNASLVDNLNKHSEDIILENEVSIETLVHFWNHWKEKIVGLIDYLLGNTTRDVSDYARCEEFCLNYFGLQKHFLNKDNVYIVLFSDANWLKKLDPSILRRNGDLVFIESRLFVSAALSYWYSVLHSVGIRVLVTLDALHLYSIKSHFSMFLQSKCLLYIIGIANFLLNYKFPNRNYCELSVKNLLGN